MVELSQHWKSVSQGWKHLLNITRHEKILRQRPSEKNLQPILQGCFFLSSVLSVNITTDVCHSFKYYALFRVLLPKFCAVYLRNWVLWWFQYLLREMFYSLDGFSVFIFFHVLWYSVSVSILGLQFFSVERVQPCKSLSSLLLFILLAFNFLCWKCSLQHMFIQISYKFTYLYFDCFSVVLPVPWYT